MFIKTTFYSRRELPKVPNLKNTP